MRQKQSEYETHFTYCQGTRMDATLPKPLLYNFLVCYLCTGVTLLWLPPQGYCKCIFLIRLYFFIVILYFNVM